MRKTVVNYIKTFDENKNKYTLKVIRKFEETAGLGSKEKWEEIGYPEYTYGKYRVHKLDNKKYIILTQPGCIFVNEDNENGG